MRTTAAVGHATPEQRKAALEEKVRASVLRGGRIESQTEYSAVLVRGRRTNHVLHLLLSLVTLGFWLIVWIGLALRPGGGEERVLFAVDEYGTVTTQRISG